MTTPESVPIDEHAWFHGPKTSAWDTNGGEIGGNPETALAAWRLQAEAAAAASPVLRQAAQTEIEVYL